MFLVSFEYSIFKNSSKRVQKEFKKSSKNSSKTVQKQFKNNSITLGKLNVIMHTLCKGPHPAPT